MAEISEALAIAVGHHQAGRLGEAEEIYRRILAAEPRRAQAWHLLGMIACEAGSFDAAIELSREALQIQPGLAEALNNLGNALKALGKRYEAGECF